MNFTLMDIINPLYIELESAKKNDSSKPGWEINSTIDALFYYKTFKPFIENKLAQIYSQPLKNFYYKVIKPASEKSLQEEKKTQ